MTPCALLAAGTQKSADTLVNGKYVTPMTLRLSSFTETEWPYRRREFRRNPLTDFGDIFDHRQTNEQTNATELINALLTEDFGALFVSFD